MGFFSQIMCEARQGEEERRPYHPEPVAADGQITLADARAPETPNPTETAEETAPANIIDLNTSETVEAERRREHESAEAKRKAEFDAKQAAKRQAEQEAVQQLATMSDEQVAEDAAKRVGADTEMLTRRNMKEMVCEHGSVPNSV